jgi:hypothetical protein
MNIINAVSKNTHHSLIYCKIWAKVQYFIFIFSLNDTVRGKGHQHTCVAVSKSVQGSCLRSSWALQVCSGHYQGRFSCSLLFFHSFFFPSPPVTFLPERVVLGSWNFAKRKYVWYGKKLRGPPFPQNGSENPYRSKKEKFCAAEAKFGLVEFSWAYIEPILWHF